MHDPLAALEAQLRLLEDQHRVLRAAQGSLVYEIGVTLQSLKALVAQATALPDQGAPEVMRLLEHLGARRAQLVALLIAVFSEDLADVMPNALSAAQEAPQEHCAEECCALDSDAAFLEAMEARLAAPRE